MAGFEEGTSTLQEKRSRGVEEKEKVEKKSASDLQASCFGWKIRNEEYIGD